MERNKTSLNESVVENLMAIYPLLSKNFARAIRTKTTFTPGVLFTLGALYHHKRLTMSGIGCHLSIPKPHATILVDKLIKEQMQTLSTASEQVKEMLILLGDLLASGETTTCCKQIEKIK